VTLLSSSVRTFERIRREHALVLSCACFSIFLALLSSGRLGLPSFNFAGSDTSRDEAALDAVLQDAATNALANREGAIIVMDAHSGRVRAIVNADAAYSQALMPGSAIKPFTALAALRAGLIDEDSRTACPGRFTGLGFSLPCACRPFAALQSGAGHRLFMQLLFCDFGPAAGTRSIDRHLARI